MQPYVRELEKRYTAQDPTGLSATWARPRPVRSPVPETWRRLAEGLSRALVDDPRAARKLGPLAECLGLSLETRWGCGATGPRLEAWCGHPWCPSCARQSASRAREAARGWEGTIGMVELPLGKRVGGLSLPGEDAVNAVRVAWGKVARQAGLGGETYPRGVLGPDGLVLFVRLGDQPDERVQAIERAAQKVGLARVSVSKATPEVAATRLHRALLLEAERFEATVGSDLSRLADVDEVGPAPGFVHRRWVEQALARAQEKRSVVIGGSNALPLPDLKSLPELPEEPPCPLHGKDCPAVALEVKDGAGRDTLWSGESERLGTRPTRQTIMSLLSEARR